MQFVVVKRQFPQYRLHATRASIMLALEQKYRAGGRNRVIKHGCPHLQMGKRTNPHRAGEIRGPL